MIWNKAERTVSYTKNGIDLGVAFRNVKDDRLFPTVGLRTPDEEVRHPAPLHTPLHGEPLTSWAPPPAFLSPHVRGKPIMLA